MLVKNVLFHNKMPGSVDVEPFPRNQALLDLLAPSSSFSLKFLHLIGLPAG